jgi:hypothetical protein
MSTEQSNWLFLRRPKNFWEPVNLVSLTILVSATIMTGDLWLLVPAAVVEGAYLSILCRTNRYRRRVTERFAMDPLDPLDIILLLVLVAGFTVIAFFGFCKHLLNQPFPKLTHTETWELGAIIWTLLFFVYYVLKLQLTKRAIDKTILSIIFAGAGFLGGALYYLQNPLLHVIMIFFSAVCLMSVDWLLSIYHNNEIEKKLSLHSLVVADLPVVFAFSVLMFYIVIHPDSDHPEVFLSGAISYQLLISNALFVVSEFDLWRVRNANNAFGKTDSK